MSVAITPGTAYGRKIASLLNRVSRVRGKSSMSANSNASPTVPGIEIAATASIRSTLCHSSASPNTEA